MLQHLTEHVADWRTTVVVEASTRTIRNAALAGAASKNGYRYAEAALKAAAPLYEGVPVFLDHPASPHRPRDRSARDLAGSVANVRYEAGRLRGDLRTLDTEAGRTLLALAAADGPGVGMSHVVLAERSGDGATVERIVEVVSVDAVAFPATTRTFTESRETRVERRERGGLVPTLPRGNAEACGRSRTSPREGIPTEDRGNEGALGARALPSPPAPLPGERGERVARVRNLMALPERRGVVPVPAGRPGSAGRPAPRSEAGPSAPAAAPPRPGSLERLLARVEAELPGRLARLAAAAGLPGPGRGGRAGVYPGHVVVEWRAAGRMPERFALSWRPDGDGVSFGDELLPLDSVAERLGSWGDLLMSSHEPASSQESDSRPHDRKETTPSPDTNVRLERLAERLRETAAERDRLAERLAARGPTSRLRQAAARDLAGDDPFVRTIRRR